MTVNEARRASASEATAGKELDGDDVIIAYIGGGSRQWVPNLVQDLALSDFDGEVRLYDVNVAAPERNAEFGNWVQTREDATADWTYTATGDLEAALDGADVVLLSTQYDSRRRSSTTLTSRNPTASTAPSPLPSAREASSAQCGRFRSTGES